MPCQNVTPCVTHPGKQGAVVVRRGGRGDTGHWMGTDPTKNVEDPPASTEQKGYPGYQHLQVGRDPRERAQPCAGNKRGKSSLRKALGWHRSQGKMGQGWGYHLPTGT